MPRHNHPRQMPQASKRGRFKQRRAPKLRKVAKKHNVLSVTLKSHIQRLKITPPDPNVVIRDPEKARRRGDLPRWMF